MHMFYFLFFILQYPVIIQVVWAPFQNRGCAHFFSLSSKTLVYIILQPGCLKEAYKLAVWFNFFGQSLTRPQWQIRWLGRSQHWPHCVHGVGCCFNFFRSNDKKFRLVAMGGWDESSMLHILETPVSSPWTFSSGWICSFASWFIWPLLFDLMSGSYAMGQYQFLKNQTKFVENHPLIKNGTLENQLPL